jgi:hypothetical protein
LQPLCPKAGLDHYKLKNHEIEGATKYHHLNLIPHPSLYLLTCFFTLVHTTLLDKDLLDPTYLVAPTYMITTPIDFATVENDKKYM